MKKNQVGRARFLCPTFEASISRNTFSFAIIPSPYRRPYVGQR